MGAEQTASSHQDTSTHTRLRGPWLTAARVWWIAIAVFALVVWGAAVAVDYSILKAWDFTPVEIRALQFLGFSTGFFPLYTEAMRVLPVLVYSAVAGVLFWRRPDDRATFLISLSLVLIGVVSSWVLWSVTGETPVLLRLSQIILVLGFASCGFLPLTFPDGRFIPRWTRWIVLAAFPWLAAATLFPKAPYSQAQGASLSLLISLLFFGVFIFSQAYRYRHVSTPVQRQQTKWGMFGFIAMFTMISALLVLQNFVPVVRDGTSLPGAVYEMYLKEPLWAIAWMIVPVTIGISMLRYRLWDIDFVINRSLVYGGLTVLLGMVFAAGFFVLRAMLHAFLGGGQAVLAVAVSTAIVVGLFNPVRRRLRAFVDRRFYSIQIEYQTRPPGQQRRPASVGVTPVQLGQYENLEKIGSGGMAEVYRAHHPTLNRTVAIKVLPPKLAEEADFRKRFEREAKATAQLKHPNIVQMYDFGVSEDDTYYMVMEFIDGPDLDSLLREGRGLPFKEALPILEGLASALDYAHHEGLVHRDIKPSNVMLDRGTSSFRPVLMDFGIAKIVGAGTRLTGTGGVLGTFDYIAPEQIQAAAGVDWRADVYSLGVMAYQMLTGELPFKRSNLGALLIAHMHQPAPDPRQVMPRLPQKVAEAVMRAMAKEPIARHATAGEFVAEMAPNQIN
jgi:tRNA A-37 threonylcarbamoyl transferase component Bud32